MDSGNFDIDQKMASPEGLALEELWTQKKKKKKMMMMIVRYKECLKNHAAAIGGNARDGCGEFMAAGEEGTADSLKCSACNCHRNFHRKHLEQSPHASSSSSSQSHYYYYNCDHHPPNLCPKNQNKSGSRSNPCDHECDDHGRKRFRTKFSTEQKEKMLRFADKAGWKMQKLEESVVQQFCQELGIKRRVLKVWMHNNKNTFANRNLHECGYVKHYSVGSLSLLISQSSSKTFGISYETIPTVVV